MRLQYLIVVLLASSVAATWTDMCNAGLSGKCPSVMMGVSCQNAGLCAIVGGYSNTAESVYYSRDGFATFQLASMKADSLMLLDLALDSQGRGATAGLGALGKTSALLYTTDVTSWTNSSDSTFMAGQDMNVLGTSGEFAYVGTTDNLKKKEGVLFSVDGGRDWVASNWPQPWADFTEARYGAFPSDTTWYVTGGFWPSNQSAAGLHEHGKDCLPLSHKTCVQVGAKHREAMQRRREGVSVGYVAIMTKTSDAGKTWQLQWNNTGAYYFNDIGCADVNTCFALAEGFSDGSAPGARVFKTTNGGGVWKQVLIDTSNVASLLRIHVVSASEVWAAGGYQDASGTPYSLFYHTIDGGKTWKNEGNVKYIGDVSGMHFVDSTLGWATGITEFQQSTLVKFSL